MYMYMYMYIHIYITHLMRQAGDSRAHTNRPARDKSGTQHQPVGEVHFIYF